MKNTRKQNIFVLTTLAAAMTGVFAAMPAYADDEERAALTQPQNSVDAEVITVSRGSPQFGQYNGLNRSGAYGNANIQFRAGDAYTGNESGGTSRVTIIGTDLGLSDRSASAKYEDQGSWSIGVGYDALTHVIGTANGYQTPYGNGVGQNNFTLPPGFGSINTSQTNGASTNSTNYKAGSQYLSTAQQNQFGPQTIQTTRDNYSLNGSLTISPQLTASFDVNHMIQSGAKLQAMAGSTMASVSNPAGKTVQEAVSILPNPTNYQTDNVNAGLNWEGGNYRVALTYFGSFFRNAYDLSGVQFQPAFSTSTAVSGAASSQVATTIGVQTMSTMPNNMMNQLALAAGYDFTDKTKLNGSLSWGRNTTSPGAAYDTLQMNSAYPVADFNGLVNQLHGDLKLIDRSVKGLTLSALAKIDQRDDQSSSNMYSAYALSTGNMYKYPNTPMSWRNGNISLAADYKIDPINSVRVAYQNDQMRRWCNSYATGSQFGLTTYPQGTSCVTANNDSTNAVDLGWKFKPVESFSFKLNGAYSVRQVDWNQNAVAAFGAGASGTSANVNPGMVTGQNAGDYLGFQPYFEASRNQFKAKAGAGWQATDQLAFNLTGQVTSDTYTSNQYGLQNGNSWSLSLDSSYNWTETGSGFIYVTQQQNHRLMTSQTSASSGGGTWSNTEDNMTTTIGAGAKEKGLMGGKLTLAGDALFSFANTNYSTNVNPLATNTNGPNGTPYNCALAGPSTSGTYNATTNPTPVTLTCGNLPSIVNNMYQLKVSGNYQLAKNQKFALGYAYNHLHSTDFYYNGLQVGNTPTNVLPTLQSAPSYAISVVTAKYIYDF